MEDDKRRIRREIEHEAFKKTARAKKEAEKIRDEPDLLIRWYEAQQERARLTADFYGAMARGEDETTKDAIFSTIEDAEYRGDVLYWALSPEDQSIARDQILELAPTSLTKQ
jgi:hypothetical protein